VPLPWNLGTLTSWNTLGHSRPVTGLIYLLKTPKMKPKPFMQKKCEIKLKIRLIFLSQSHVSVSLWRIGRGFAQPAKVRGGTHGITRFLWSVFLITPLHIVIIKLTLWFFFFGQKLKFRRMHVQEKLPVKFYNIPVKLWFFFCKVYLRDSQPELGIITLFWSFKVYCSNISTF